jgi:hypothetical protein
MTLRYVKLVYSFIDSHRGSDYFVAKHEFHSFVPDCLTFTKF